MDEWRTTIIYIIFFRSSDILPYFLLCRSLLSSPLSPYKRTYLCEQQVALHMLSRRHPDVHSILKRRLNLGVTAAVAATATATATTATTTTATATTPTPTAPTATGSFVFREPGVGLRGCVDVLLQTAGEGQRARQQEALVGRKCQELFLGAVGVWAGGV